MKHISPHIFTLLFVLAAAFSLEANAQTKAWTENRKGNRAMASKNVNAARRHYEAARAEGSAVTASRATYNLGNAFLAAGRDSVALYEETAKNDASPVVRSMANHNIGFVYQSHAMDAQDEGTRQNLLRTAISYYKKALRDNPASDPSRYNLALCQKLLKDSKDKKNPPQPKPQPQQQQQKQQSQLTNYARQAEQQTQQKIRKQPQQRALRKNW